jgi:transcriptional regulator with XRE-family HTH domain
MVGKCLQEIRKKMGFPSARAFYQYLESRSDLDFNYSYYKRFENGQTLPSSKVINNLAALLPTQYGEQLILAYCSANFPSHEHLFSQSQRSLVPPPRPSTTPQKGQQTVIVQRTLTERQVGLIASTQQHYYLFLLVVLSREPLDFKDLLVHFPERALNEILADFKEQKIIYIEENKIQAAYPEFRFPPAEGKALTQIYQRLDQFDVERPKFFGMEKLKSAEMFRRISPRYLELILSHLDVLLKTVRMSEEADSSANTDVISFSLRFHRGRLPG